MAYDESTIKLLENIGEDKIIFLPGKGESSCSDIRNMHQRCSEFYSKKQGFLTICDKYKRLSTTCFRKSEKEFYIQLERERHESENLLKYLEKRKSKIPMLLKENGNLDYFNLFGADLEENIKNKKRENIIIPSNNKINVEEYLQNFNENEEIFKNK